MIQNRGNQPSKNIAEERRQITPGMDQPSSDHIEKYPDSDSFVEEESDSSVSDQGKIEQDSEQQPSQDPSKLVQIKQQKQKEQQKQQQQQSWSDTPTFIAKVQQKAQWDIQQPEKPQKRRRQRQKPIKQQNQRQGNRMRKQNAEVQQKAQWDIEQPEKPETKRRQGQKLEQQQNKRQGNRKRKQVNELLFKKVTYDSRYLLGAYYLLKQQFKEIIPPSEGYVSINPFKDSRNLYINYKDKKKINQFEQKIDDCINDLSVIQVQRSVAQSGVMVCKKYQEQMIKQKMIVFQDKSQNSRVPAYYICGKVTKKALHSKISEIKKMAFSWIYFYAYQDTRSYRAILERILQTNQVHQFINNKFKAKQIELAHSKSELPIKKVKESNQLLVIMSYVGDYKSPFHKQIQQSIYQFINQTFLAFCYIFKNKEEKPVSKYIPKLEKIQWFFVQEKNDHFCYHYLFIIVKKQDLADVRQKAIEEIQKMQLNIRGQRFFKNINPQYSQSNRAPNTKVYSFPRVYPYSWSIRAERGHSFDWKSKFKL